jgi:hypothetical protein
LIFYIYFYLNKWFLYFFCWILTCVSGKVYVAFSFLVHWYQPLCWLKLYTLITHWWDLRRLLYARFCFKTKVYIFDKIMFVFSMKFLPPLAMTNLRWRTCGAHKCGFSLFNWFFLGSPFLTKFSPYAWAMNQTSPNHMLKGIKSLTT